MKKQLKKTAKNAPENLFDSTLLPNQHCRCSLAIILSSRPPYKAYNLGLQTVVFTIILSQSHSALCGSDHPPRTPIRPPFAGMAVKYCLVNIQYIMQWVQQWLPISIASAPRYVLHQILSEHQQRCLPITRLSL